MARWHFALFLAFLPAWAGAGTFELDASVDRNELDLGDSLHFTLRVTEHDNLAFQPQVTTPTFDGFEAQGPQTAYSVSWVNGSQTLVQTWTWELEAQKSGRLVLGPYHAMAKDALNGDIERATTPIVITVRQPKGLNYPSLNPTPEPQEPDGTLRDIKPDRGLPWILVGEALAALLVLLTVLALLSQPAKRKEPEEILPADPAQAALLRLDKALQAFMVSADARAYSASVGEVLRVYLRQRLELKSGMTLAESVRALRFQAPTVQPQRLNALRARLELLIYGGAAFTDGDREALDGEARDLVRGVEAAKKLTPAQLELAKNLERLAGLFKEGQAKGAWMGMRSAVQLHLKAALGLGRRAVPYGPLAAALKTFESPDLLRCVEWLRSEQPPRGVYPEDLIRRLGVLAQAADTLDKNLLALAAAGDEAAEDAPPDPSGPDAQGER